MTQKYFKYHISLKKKLIYFHIDKCASTSLRECLTNQSDFIPVYNSRLYKIENYNHFAVIRNPKSRWISGLNEFMVGNPKDDLRNYIEKELEKNNFIFDGYTKPQNDFLSLRTTDTILLRLTKNLNEKISSLLKEDVQLKYKNTTSENLNKKINLNFCKKMFEVYCEKNPKYYKTYQLDYRLFNLSQ